MVSFVLRASLTRCRVEVLPRHRSRQMAAAESRKDFQNTVAFAEVADRDCSAANRTLSTRARRTSMTSAAHARGLSRQKKNIQRPTFAQASFLCRC